MDNSLFFEQLQQYGVKPAYFGLGFIQLKISENERYHFYHPEAQPIVNYLEEVHDHRYDFVSTLISGEINNKIFQFEPTQKSKASHYKEKESCNPDIKLSESDNPKEYGNITLFADLFYSEGQAYFMDYRSFHTVEAKKAVTFLIRTGYKQEFSNVIRPVSAMNEKICPFSKSIPEADCWRIIKDCLDL